MNNQNIINKFIDAINRIDLADDCEPYMDEALQLGCKAVVEKVAGQKALFNRFISTKKASRAITVLHEDALSVVVVNAPLTVYAFGVRADSVRDTSSQSLNTRAIQEAISRNRYYVPVRHRRPIHLDPRMVTIILIKDAGKPNDVFRDPFRHGDIPGLFETPATIDNVPNIVVFNSTGRLLQIRSQRLNDNEWSPYCILSDYGGIVNTRWIEIDERLDMKYES